MREFPAIYLLHGKGGSPEGSVSVLEGLLRRSWPEMQYVRPELPHGRNQQERPAEDSVAALLRLSIPEGSLMVGISMGGLVAAKLQEQFRTDLHVIAVSSPTWADAIELQHKAHNRIALYSSRDEVIADRVDHWPNLAEAYDLPWLTHDTDKYRYPISHLISAYIKGQDLAWEVQHINEASVI